MVGLFVLRQLWVGRDYLCPNRRSTSCIQLSDRAGSLRHQFGARYRARLLLGWIIATLGGIGGLYWSFYSDLPSGAAIVCTFGGFLCSCLRLRY